MLNHFALFIDRLRSRMPVKHRSLRRVRSKIRRINCVECCESRLLLTTLNTGAEITTLYQEPPGVTGPQENAVSIASSSDGSKTVEVVADNTAGTGGHNSVRVLEFTSTMVSGVPENLALSRSYVLTSGTNLALSGSGYAGGEPLVAMNGSGSTYVVTWGGPSGVIQAAEVSFGGSTITGPTTIVNATNTAGTKTYTTTGTAYSIAMRDDGTFVLAWNSNMVDSSNPGTSYQEAEAQVFNVNLTAGSSIIQGINSLGTSWNPIVAWTNHGGNNGSTWDVAWSGIRPGKMVMIPPNQYQFIVQSGVWLQQYSFTTGSPGSNSNTNSTLIIAETSSGGFETYGQFALSDDPAGNAGFIGTPSLSMGPAAIWLYNSSLLPFQPANDPSQTYPLTNFTPTDPNGGGAECIGSIALDASGTGGQFKHVVVGTEHFAEGPGVDWGYLDVTTSGSFTWAYTGNLYASPYIQDMFADVVINAAGNGWVLARQFGAGSGVTGWKTDDWWLT